MASRNILPALVIFVAALSALSQATEHIVGDNFGWTPGFNYTVWAQGKQFRVGDTLVFKYTEGENSVFKVGRDQFQQCAFPPANEALTTGNDVVTLAAAGPKWYISGAGNGRNCRAGQKLVVVVLSSPSPLLLHALHHHASAPEMTWPGVPATAPSSWESPSPTEMAWGVPASSWESPSPSDVSKVDHGNAPSSGEDATANELHKYFNRFLKY